MPKPVLQAMVLADHVYQDRSTGKFIICGTFTRILRSHVTPLPADGRSEVQGERKTFGTPPAKMGSPFLYLALVEVHGQVELELKFVDLSDATVLLDGRIGITSSDPVALAEFVFSMPPLPIDNRPPGSYSLDLLYEGEPLGSWRIQVKDIPPKLE